MNFGAVTEGGTLNAFYFFSLPSLFALAVALEWIGLSP